MTTTTSAVSETGQGITETGSSIQNPSHNSSQKASLELAFAESIPHDNVTLANAAFYVVSGCAQPILMTTCRDAGLANSSSQLYMLFYYIGPALVIIPLWFEGTRWPSRRTVLRGCGIAFFDICSQTLNYTGASLAGPTIFAIVYSSVTVWTAVFSQLLLGRTMNRWQWLSVVVVFGGLTLTATDSAKLGGEVLHGLLLVVVGSIMHALTYVMLEGIMTVGDQKLSIPQNCAVQGMVAATCFFLWQVVYTIPRWETLIGDPMQEAGTTVWMALGILVLFAGTNLIHAMTFLHTLKWFEGGATSAGVMKGLQAVFVFVATHFLYCGRSGGEEMCFTRGKFLSLITVAGGVTAYGVATSNRERTGSRGTGQGYQQIIQQLD
jgi:drug/metabolite transporter (DMT)-like permease